MCLSVVVKVSHGKTENFRHLTDAFTAREIKAETITHALPVSVTVRDATVTVASL